SSCIADAVSLDRPPGESRGVPFRFSDYVRPVANVGPLEILVVLVIALIVFGPKRLPELGRSLGDGLRGSRTPSREKRTRRSRMRTSIQVSPAGSRVAHTVSRRRPGRHPGGFPSYIWRGPANAFAI